MSFYPREDLIDFPTSPLWAEYYADQGMNPGFPEAYYYKPPEEDSIPKWVDIERAKPDWAKAVIGRLEQQQGQIRFLQNKINEHLDKAKTFRKTKYQGLNIVNKP